MLRRNDSLHFFPSTCLAKSIDITNGQSGADFSIEAFHMLGNSSRRPPLGLIAKALGTMFAVQPDKRTQLKAATQ